MADQCAPGSLGHDTLPMGGVWKKNPKFLMQKAQLLLNVILNNESLIKSFWLDHFMFSARLNFMLFVTHSRCWGEKSPHRVFSQSEQFSGGRAGFSAPFTGCGSRYFLYPFEQINLSEIYSKVTRIILMPRPMPFSKRFYIIWSLTGCIYYILMGL